MSDNEWSVDQLHEHYRSTGEMAPVVPDMKPKPKGSKYGAIRTEVDGVTFASKAEAKHYRTLQLRLAAGEISDLELQPRYPLEVNGVKIGRYTGDFRYIENGRVVVVDVKGSPSRDYVLRKKLMKAVHGIEIVEVAA